MCSNATLSGITRSNPKTRSARSTRSLTNRDRNRLRKLNRVRRSRRSKLQSMPRVRKTRRVHLLLRLRRQQRSPSRENLQPILLLKRTRKFRSHFQVPVVANRRSKKPHKLQRFFRSFLTYAIFRV